MYEKSQIDLKNPDFQTTNSELDSTFEYSYPYKEAAEKKSSIQKEMVIKSIVTVVAALFCISEYTTILHTGLMVFESKYSQFYNFRVDLPQIQGYFFPSKRSNLIRVYYEEVHSLLPIKIW